MTPTNMIKSIESWMLDQSIDVINDKNSLQANTLVLSGFRTLTTLLERDENKV